MRCSKRWAKPVRPGRSFFEPTWYQTFTATMGQFWSAWISTSRPLSSLWRTNGMFMLGGAAVGVIVLAIPPSVNRYQRRSAERGRKFRDLYRRERNRLLGICGDRQLCREALSRCAKRLRGRGVRFADDNRHAGIAAN